jgi:hypothetical protein
MVEQLLRAFPRLRVDLFRVTSPRDLTYNCIAWAAGVMDAYWWPVGDGWPPYWPEGVPREETLAAFQAAFAALGYLPCAREEHEPGFEKVALFVATTGCPTHAARQLASGRWTSKLGKAEDIEHDLRALEGEVYGSVVLVLKRPLPASALPTA